MKTRTHFVRPVALTLALTLLSGSLPVVTEEPDAVSGASIEEGADAGPATPAEGEPDAVSGATQGGGAPLQPSILGKNLSLDSHRIAGYASGGLLLAAGAIGAWRYLDMRDDGHDFRDSADAVSGASLSGSDDECKEAIHDAWADNQALRWAHVGLVVTGESLYLYDAATGISLMGKNKTPTTAGKIHRVAFFVHAGLMVADIVTGILLTSALDRGNHDQVVALGGTHAGIGIAIPLVILGSGVAADVMTKNEGYR
jgi:hypothetical protein